MNIRKFWLLIVAVSLLMILIFSVAGCRLEFTFKKTAEEKAVEEEKSRFIETLNISEKPDKELFDKYFSDMQMDENILLPHRETMLTAGFKNKSNFTFKCTVLNLETNEFIKRCTTTVSPEGADGFGMEVLEWAFLRPGSYKYRVYVEDTLIAALPFEVISYIDYFEAEIDKVKLCVPQFFENLREEK